MKHKYAEFIIAWANGFKIQMYWSGTDGYTWIDVENPVWDIENCRTIDGEAVTIRFRIKPTQEKTE
jgi:hypothetical protein